MDPCPQERRPRGGGIGWLLALFAAAGCTMFQPNGQSQPPAVQQLEPARRQELRLAPFYGKVVPLGDFVVAGSARVSDAALREGAWIVRHLTAHRPELLTSLATAGVHLTVMAWNEFTTDVPEHSGLTPAVFWDRRARGLGATLQAPAVSCAEENLLEFPGDPYPTENLCIHEFAHALHEVALQRLDPTFDQRLTAAFHLATQRGLWTGTYAGSNRQEYWAEASQCWFDDNRENDALHNHVNTRGELRDYDPGVAALCEEVYGDGAWRYFRPSRRPERERAHLRGWNLKTAPHFVWRSPPAPPHPRVLVQTTLGEFELELETEHAPQTTLNFLRYVEAGYYGDGHFWRAVTRDNQPTNQIKIEVIQAGANPARASAFFPPIPLERTRDTGLRHLDGTVSMARLGPDSAQDGFFICTGDQPELDFGGRRNPDGQGFAAFGKVIRGMETIRAIQAQPKDGQALKSPVKIQRAIRLN